MVNFQIVDHYVTDYTSSVSYYVCDSTLLDQCVLALSLTLFY